MADIFYIDGEFVERDQASIPITDLGVLRGYGIFDFLRTYKGEPFHLEAHVDRLYRSADLLGMKLPWPRDEVSQIVLDTLGRSPHAESNVRIVVTGGESDDFITPQNRPRLAVLVTKAKPPADDLYINGAKIVTVDESRYLPGAKSLNYIPAIRAMRVAREIGAVEAIYKHAGNHALEGTTTNLFVFNGDTIITPEEQILPGITRGVVIELARERFTLEERAITLDELYNADEVFITASNKQVMPVIQVDDVTIASGKPGPRTRQIMTAFGKYTGVPLPMPQPSGD